MAEVSFDVKNLASEVQKSIADLKATGEDKTRGVITRVGDGVAWIYGLHGCGYSETHHCFCPEFIRG
jgi:F0F1-type ATP synthase alpha subunit